MEQAPEARIGLTLDDVHAHEAVFEGEARESGQAALQNDEGSHKAAVGRAVEEASGWFGRHGQTERVKVFAVLDVVLPVFDQILGKRRGEDAALAEGAMAEFGASVAPSDNSVAEEELCGFSVEL